MLKLNKETKWSIIGYSSHDIFIWLSINSCQWASSYFIPCSKIKWSKISRREIIDISCCIERHQIFTTSYMYNFSICISQLSYCFLFFRVRLIIRCSVTKLIVFQVINSYLWLLILRFGLIFLWCIRSLWLQLISRVISMLVLPWAKCRSFVNYVHLTNYCCLIFQNYCKARNVFWTEIWVVSFVTIMWCFRSFNHQYFRWTYAFGIQIKRHESVWVHSKI